MATLPTYTCSSCGQQHTEWPALAFHLPDNYYGLSEEERQTIAEVSPDTCVITYEDQTDRFIRCFLLQEVTDHCEDLEYGLWVSLSEKSFEDYVANYHDENHEASYFGWLCNRIDGYEEASIPTSVHASGGQRPEIVPHKDFDHPFVRDYYNGISKEEVERRIARMISLDENP